MEPEPTADHDDESTATGLKQVISDEVKSLVASTLATFPDLVKQAVEQLFRIATANAHGGSHTVGYDATKYVILFQTMTSILRETIKKHAVHYCEAGKHGDALGKRLLCNDEFLATIASLVQTQTMYNITYQCRVGVFESTSMENGDRKDTYGAAKANFVHKLPARATSKRSSEKS